MSKTVVYTAICGEGRDELRDIEPAANVDYVCFTDQLFTSSVWDVRPFDFKDENDVLTSRQYKILPHKYFPEHEKSIWVDGAIAPFKKIIDIGNSVLSDLNIAAHLHPRRRSACDELAFLISLKRWSDTGLHLQLNEYNKAGLPRNLWETGVLFRRHNETNVIKTMEVWWVELLKYRQFRDQPSFVYSLFRTGLNIFTIKNFILRVDYLKYYSHKRK